MVKDARALEAQFNTLCSISVDAIISTDRALRINFFSASAETIFGYQAHEVLSHSIDELLPESFRPVLRDHARFLACNSTSSCRLEIAELQGQRKCGATFPVEGSISQVELVGEVVFILVLRDLSERTRVQEQCRQLLISFDTERAWFHTLIEQASEGILIADMQGNFIDANPAVCRHLGYSRDELLSMRIVDTLPPEEVPRLTAAKEALLQSADHSQVSEWTLKRKDGVVIPVEISAKILTDGQWLAFVRDISERKRMEDEQRLLATSGLHLVTSLNPAETIRGVAQDAVPTLADLCVVYLLDVQRRGYAMDVAATDSRIEKLLLEALATCSHEVKTHNRLIAEVLHTGKTLLIPTLEAAPAFTDEWFVALARVLPLSSLMTVPLHARGQILGVLLLATSGGSHLYNQRDQAIAEEWARRAALAIDNAYLYEMAQHATRLRDEVMRIVAHDLRNPLNSISLSAQILLKLHTCGSELPRECLERILLAIRRGDRIVQDLLDVARMEAGNLSIRKRPEALASIIQDVVELHRPLAEDKSLQFEAVVEEKLPPIEADRDRLMQVLSNLLGNAIKFTPPNGRIALRARRAEAGALISVSDTGPGIAPKDLPRVFDLFWQASKGVRDGVGLGLNIAKGLVEAHGGCIWVENIPESGACFSFTLPLSQ